MPKCTGIKRNGSACKAFAMHGSDFCYAHINKDMDILLDLIADKLPQDILDDIYVRHLRDHVNLKAIKMAHEVIDEFMGQLTIKEDTPVEYENYLIGTLACGTTAKYGIRFNATFVNSRLQKFSLVDGDWVFSADVMGGQHISIYDRSRIYGKYRDMTKRDIARLRVAQIGFALFVSMGLHEKYSAWQEDLDKMRVRLDTENKLIARL